MTKDYYKVLGVDKTANADQIKHAYRDLAMKFHPDKNKASDAESKFKEINEAYAVLSDPQKRQQYDSFGPDQFNQRFTQEDIFRGYNIEDIMKSFNEGDLNSMFNIAGFGGFQQMRNMDVGNDLVLRLNVSAADVEEGIDKRISVVHVKKCEECKGAGIEKGSKMIVCDECKGSGHTRRTVKIPFGVMETVTICSKCGGQGKRAERICKVCHGSGRVRVNDNVVMKVPRGITDGSKLRLAGMGDYGADHTGDLYVDIRITGVKKTMGKKFFGVF